MNAGSSVTRPVLLRRLAISIARSFSVPVTMGASNVESLSLISTFSDTGASWGGRAADHRDTHAARHPLWVTLRQSRFALFALFVLVARCAGSLVAPHAARVGLRVAEATLLLDERAVRSRNAHVFAERIEHAEGGF